MASTPITTSLLENVDDELAQHTGIIPTDIHVEREYYESLEKKHQLLGLFAADAELIDEITESAMQAREQKS